MINSKIEVTALVVFFAIFFMEVTHGLLAVFSLAAIIFCFIVPLMKKNINPIVDSISGSEKLNFLGPKGKMVFNFLFKM